MVLQVENLTKVYRKPVRANDGVTLDVAAGKVVGLLGHNGAGKTTLLNQVIGLTRPTSGTITIDGIDVVANPAHARRTCSLQPQSHAPLEGVTPRQVIELVARLRGASRQRARERTAELITALDLEPWAKTVGERLSGGIRRLTAFCLAAAQPGRVVMLDEPTNDVDPVRRRLLWQQVRALADAGSAVLLVTHGVAEAERVVDRLAILHHGRVVAQGTPAELRGSLDDQLRLEVHAASESVAEELRPPAGAPTVAGRRVVATIAPHEAADAIAWAQRERMAGRVDQFAVNPASLEDVYIGLLGQKEVDRAA